MSRLPGRTTQISQLLLVELRGLEPLASSMPRWPGRRKRGAASVDGVPGRARGATSTQPGSPSVCPPCLDCLPFTNLTPAVPSHLIVGLDHASVRVHAGSCGASQALAAHRRRSPCRHIRSVWLLVMAPDFCLIRSGGTSGGGDGTAGVRPQMSTPSSGLWVRTHPVSTPAEYGQLSFSPAR